MTTKQHEGWPRGYEPTTHYIADDTISYGWKHDREDGEFDFYHAAGWTEAQARKHAWDDYWGELQRSKSPEGILPSTQVEPILSAVESERDRTAQDMVNSPDHYTAGGVETIDSIQASMLRGEFQAYCRGNAIKYLSRAGRKGPAREDIRKAVWYLEKWLEVEDG